MNKFLLLVVLCVVPVVHADTGDYIWNEQYKKKLVQAEAGDNQAQYELGQMYLKGRGTDVDEQEAFKWFSMAAEHGHMKAEYKLGHMYLTGKGVSKSHRQAMKWLTVAANKGYGPAQYHLGRMYARGQSVDRDHEQALAWFLKAEKSGYSPATQAVSKVRAQLENERQEAAKLAKLEESSRRNAVVQKPAKPESKRNSGAKKAGAVDARVELEGSLWTRNGEPAAELPSLFNDCKFLDERIVCMSRELTHFTDDADITYLMEATIANFGGRGAFEVSYRKNITQVLSSDMDDPDVSVPDIKLGWHTKRTMKCTFKKRNLVACKNDRNQIQAYSRQ